MTRDKSWRDKAKKGSEIDEGQLADLKRAVEEFQTAAVTLMDHIDPNDAVEISRGYQELIGDTTLPGGVFRMLAVLTPEMVGEAEAGWFRKIAGYGRRLMNSVMGIDIDNHDSFGNLADHMPDDPMALVAFSKMSRAVQTINEILPPEQERGAERS